jgi:N-acetylated-alpha-linked acidic dipeptidase
MLARFKEWGWDASIERFDVLFPTPKERVLELVEPTKFTAKLDEPVVSVDPTSGQKSEQLPSHNAYSIDGDVTAPLGTPTTAASRTTSGSSAWASRPAGQLSGAVWQIFRGVKAKIAFEHGASGCLIYSDPKDDGFAAGPVFPSGPMRPSDGVQRGSVSDLGSAAGDPLTIGIGAVPGARRTSIAESPIITKIPVLPISYGDAQPLLAAMGGPMAPEAWRGRCRSYRLGPARQGAPQGRVQLGHQAVSDVIAKIPGPRSRTNGSCAGTTTMPG